ncbi:high affinity immunoglobulin epsilon receptor subunit beta-like [Enhydra lutris kenyoni]|uniref:high affinity immunoglobulin epsilon receptor subunit beta-like n=1 Tax=Enhydra lutris kenyoni TaxID=391180 RepID=UPI000BB46DC2|nr:high affinity immunoglobulin epsilon receptor subunit beta-like [Enhydra lutris kenyoni]
MRKHRDQNINFPPPHIGTVLDSHRRDISLRRLQAPTSLRWNKPRMNKTLASDRMPVDIPPNQNQSTLLGKTEISSTLKYLLDKLQKFLKENLEALGVAQIMIGVKCFFYGIIGFLPPNSEMHRIIFFSIYTGFSFWGALSFIISGILTVVSAKKQTKSLLRGNLGANTLSTLVSFVGICILSCNLTKNGHYDCKKETLCLGIKSVATGLVIVLMILTCLQILISLPLSMLNYNVNDKDIHWISLLFRWKTPSESIYEEVFPQTSINQELQRKKETTSRYSADTSKQT